MRYAVTSPRADARLDNIPPRLPRTWSPPPMAAPPSAVESRSKLRIQAATLPRADTRWYAPSAMAKVCVQCDKKIGFFKSPIDEIYCSYACRDAARRDIADNQKRAAERQAEAARAAHAAEAQAATEAAQAKADDAVKHTCPKCSAAWKYNAGSPESGACGKCGFATEFTAIEKCPTCTCMSLVVSAAGERCPRCKFRRA